MTWFETKFQWFISSEGYLCLMGKDWTTQDILLKRYMRPERDIVVNSNLEGSMAVLIRNRSAGDDADGDEFFEVPPLTIQEAAVFCLAKSTAAWSKKSNDSSAYWIYGHQLRLKLGEIRNKQFYLEGDLKNGK